MIETAQGFKPAGETGLLDSKDPALLARINQILGRQIEGQERVRLLVFLVAFSSKTQYSLAIMLQGDPGAGKSTVCKVVTGHFNNTVEITAGTAKFLDYWPTASVEGMIFYVPEAPGIRNANPSLRILLSEGRLVKAYPAKDEKTGKTRTELVTVEGKPVYISTTTSVKLEQQLENRILVDSMDQSPEQIRSVLLFQADKASRPGTEETRPEPELLHFVGNHSPRTRVLVPFLETYAGKLPHTRTLIFRRFKQFEYLVKILALLHREQRLHVTVNGEEFVVADPVDALYARDLLGPGGIITRLDRRLQSVYEYMEPQAKKNYTTTGIARAFNKSQDWARKILDELWNVGLVSKDVSMREYFYAKLESNIEQDPLQPEFLKGYETDGPELGKWLAGVKAYVKDPRPEAVIEYVAPLNVVRRQPSIRTESELIRAESTQPEQSQPVSTQIEPRLRTDDRPSLADYT